jgi:hypothetical protein
MYRILVRTKNIIAQELKQSKENFLFNNRKNMTPNKELIKVTVSVRYLMQFMLAGLNSRMIPLLPPAARMGRPATQNQFRYYKPFKYKKNIFQTSKFQITCRYFSDTNIYFQIKNFDNDNSESGSYKYETT